MKGKEPLTPAPPPLTFTHDIRYVHRAWFIKQELGRTPTPEEVNSHYFELIDDVNQFEEAINHAYDTKYRIKELSGGLNEKVATSDIGNSAVMSGFSFGGSGTTH